MTYSDLDKKLSNGRVFLVGIVIFGCYFSFA